MDIRISANIPEEYIPSGAQRMEMYKKISLIGVPLDMSDVLDEFIDRFGIPPKEVRRLLKISLIRALASRCDMKKVEHRDGALIFFSDKLSLGVWSMVFEKFAMLSIRGTTSPTVQARVKSADEAIDLAMSVLEKYFEIITPGEEDNAKKED